LCPYYSPVGFGNVVLTVMCQFFNTDLKVNIVYSL